MKSKLAIIISLISIVIIFKYYQNTGIGKPVSINTIKEGSIQKFGKYSFIIKFSNLIYEENGMQIKIPIFQGNMGDIKYDEFLSYCHNSNLLSKEFRESGFVIKTKKGELKKTFHEFLKFYKGNILKDIDINKPAKMNIYDGILDIYYDFQVNSIPFVLQITVYTVEDYFNTKSIKSVFDINVDENMKTSSPFFNYLITKNQTSSEL